MVGGPSRAYPTLALALALLASGGPGKTWVPLTAAAEAAAVRTVTVEGYTGMTGCSSTGGKQATALAVFPGDAAANRTYPLVAFAHGMNCDPAEVYTAMLEAVAAQGYIVVAPNGDNDGWCVQQYKDQLRGIDVAYARRGGFPFSAIDWAKGVALLGHSMGAHATVQSAGLKPATAPVAIKAAVAFAPQFFPPGEPSFADRVRVPVLYVTATGDKIVPPAKVLQQYNATRAALGHGVAELQGFNHMSVSTSAPFAYFTASFFNCHLLGRQQGSYSCDSIYNHTGAAWCPLCGRLEGCPHTWPMHTCKTVYIKPPKPAGAAPATTIARVGPSD